VVAADLVVEAQGAEAERAVAVGRVRLPEAVDPVVEAEPGPVRAVVMEAAEVQAGEEERVLVARVERPEREAALDRSPESG
jgi:hypothetical protein